MNKTSIKRYKTLSDSTLTFSEKVASVLTPYQQGLALRENVTKSLIVAVNKAVNYKKPDTIFDWVGRSTKDFFRVLPLISTPLVQAS